MATYPCPPQCGRAEAAGTTRPTHPRGTLSGSSDNAPRSRQGPATAAATPCPTATGAYPHRRPEARPPVCRPPWRDLAPPRYSETAPRPCARAAMSRRDCAVSGAQQAPARAEQNGHGTAHAVSRGKSRRRACASEAPTRHCSIHEQLRQRAVHRRNRPPRTPLWNPEGGYDHRLHLFKYSRRTDRRFRRQQSCATLWHMRSALL
jgi:hypothetical protein